MTTYDNIKLANDLHISKGLERMGNSLKQKILNVCEDQRGIAEELAKIAGYANGTGLLRAIREERNLSFYGLLKVVRHLFPDQEKELMVDHALTVDVNKKTARYLLEYFEINKLHESKRRLINKMLNCKNLESQEFAAVYNIDDQYLTGEIDYLEAIKLYDSLKIKKSDEMKAGIVLFKNYCYMDKQMHSISYELAKNLDEVIDNFKETYIQETFYSRLMIFRVAFLVRDGKIQQSRDLCSQLINRVEDSYFKSWAFLHLGNSYIVSDYKKANFYLTTGYKLSQGEHDIAEKNIKRSLNFVNTLWGKQADHLNLKSNHPSDVHEVIFYYIKKGQKTEALKKLNQMNLDEMTVSNKAFHYYFRGFVENPIENFSLSVKCFMEANDVHFRNLPIIELKKLGIHESVLNILAV